MYLTNEIDALISQLNTNSYFDEIKIIKAFPYTDKPTRLNKIVVAVSPSKINAENISTGGECLYGEYSIDFDIFIPVNKGTPVDTSVIEQLICTVAVCCPKAVSVSEITANNNIFCYTAKCTFTFSGEIAIGG